MDTELFKFYGLLSFNIHNGSTVYFLSTPFQSFWARYFLKNARIYSPNDVYVKQEFTTKEVKDRINVYIINLNMLSSIDKTFLDNKRFRYLYTLYGAFDDEGYFRDPGTTKRDVGGFFVSSDSKIPIVKEYEANMCDLSSGCHGIWLSSDWYDIEKDFCWTQQNSTLYIFLKPEEDYELSIETQFPVVDNEISVYVDEKIIGKVRSNSESRFVFLIPKNITNESFLSVRIHVNRVFIPDETIHNGDKRQLGISVKRIKIRELSSTT
jgi:hypothetical protein